MKTRTAKVSADQGTTRHRQGSASRSPDRVSGSIVLQPRTANSLHVSRASSDNRATPEASEASGRSQSQPSIHSEGGVQPEEAVPPEVFVEICSSSLESTRTPPNQAKHPTPEERLSESLNDRWKSPAAAGVQRRAPNPGLSSRSAALPRHRRSSASLKQTALLWHAG
ncbi:hypothetical protein OJAV_G00211120 [Oryzias javanicus]|uniref:Uncharacterized protein n=1 Tax=Oryzias javanicus TaxID=123683 RepID=A0A3S2PNW9_ORYJA|nr:hypothetical protein OJAV_G00211120 [Oryzias javanicus]